MIGKKTKLPAADAAPSPPITIPRLATNQRFAIVAAKTKAIDPVPHPTKNPQQITSAQGEVAKTAKPAPRPIDVSAPITTRRTPKRSIKAAAKGAVSPYIKIFTLSATDRSARDQPNSSSIGTIKTDGVDRIPAAPISARNPTPAATHEGWMGFNRLIIHSPRTARAPLSPLLPCAEGADSPNQKAP